MGKQDKTLFVIFLAIIALLLFKYSIPFTILDEALSNQYRIDNETALGYSITKTADKPFGFYSEGNNVEGESYFYLTNTPLQNVLGSDLLWQSAGSSNGGNVYVYTRNFSLDPSRLEEFLFDFDHSSSLNGCNSRETGGGARSNSEIHLIDRNSSKEFILYTGKVLSPGLNGADSYNKAGRIVIFNNFGEFILDVYGERNTLIGFKNGSQYELVIKSYVSVSDCGSWHDSITMDQEIEITNIAIRNKEIPAGQNNTNNQTEDNSTFYRFFNNTCISVSILPSQKTADDYTTLVLCQGRIIGQNNTQNNQTINNGTAIIYSNGTIVYINKTTPPPVTPPPTSLLERYGFSLFVFVILGSIILWLITRRKK